MIGRAVCSPCWFSSVQLTLSEDISLASSRGIDGFVLNVGSDYWQRSRVNDAYSAAQNSGTDFKLCLSFDMTSLPCQNAEDAASLKQYVSDYSTHAHQLFYDNKIFVSTFSGEHCLFGMGNLNDAWSSVVRSGPPVFFAPAFFVDPTTFSSITVMDGALNVRIFCLTTLF
jgi:glucan endo-1,3-alpha-glucosidase